MNAPSWFQANNRKAILVPGARANEAGQCWVAGASFLHDVYALPYVYAPGALTVWTQSLLTKYGFTRLPASSNPQPGDLAFYDGRVGAPQGHVSMVSRGGTPTDFYAYDSNWGGGAYVSSDGFPVLHEVHHADKYNGYIVGFYRPPSATPVAASAPTNQQEIPMIIQNADNWFARCDKTMRHVRGRGLGREEFTKYAVGAEFLRWVEAVEDSTEADGALHAQEVGQVAVRDNWQGQIEGLLGQLKSVQDQLTSLQSKPPEVIIKEVPKLVEQCSPTLLTTKPVSTVKAPTPPPGQWVFNLLAALTKWKTKA